MPAYGRHGVCNRRVVVERRLRRRDEKQLDLWIASRLVSDRRAAFTEGFTRSHSGRNAGGRVASLANDN